MDASCNYKLKASRDALEVISGKWRLPIIISLTYGNKRFGEIERDITDISPKMLSKELKELEAFSLITRKVFATTPVTVEYGLTDLGHSLSKLLDELLNWGIHFRAQIMQANHTESKGQA